MVIFEKLLKNKKEAKEENQEYTEAAVSEAKPQIKKPKDGGLSSAVLFYFRINTALMG